MGNAVEAKLYEALLRAQSEAGDGVMIVDAATRRITFVNGAMCRMYGYSREEMLALPDVLQLTHPDELKRVAQRAARRRADERVESRYETAAVAKDGRRVEIEVSIQPVEIDGRPHLVSITRDITERKLAEQALRQQTMARDFVRRLLHEVLTRARVPESVLREIGRHLVDTTHGVAENLASFEALGLGRLRLARHEAATYTFEGDDLLEVRRGTTRPTCYLTLAYLEGAAAAADHRSTLGSEVKCQSRGDAACVFVVTAR
jgi:PAS domain S-box-containing protein